MVRVLGIHSILIALIADELVSGVDMLAHHILMVSGVNIKVSLPAPSWHCHRSKSVHKRIQNAWCEFSGAIGARSTLEGVSGFAENYSRSGSVGVRKMRGVWCVVVWRGWLLKLKRSHFVGETGTTSSMCDMRGLLMVARHRPLVILDSIRSVVNLGPKSCSKVVVGVPVWFVLLDGRG